MFSKPHYSYDASLAELYLHGSIVLVGQGPPPNKALSARGTAEGQDSDVPLGGHSVHMSQSNRVGHRISSRSLAGHERLPVRLSHVASANR